MVVGTTPLSVRPMTTTLRPGVVKGLVGVEYSPMIIMAHRGSATPAPTSGTGTESTGADSTDDQFAPDPTSGAAGARVPLWLSGLGLAAGLAVVVAM